MVGHSKCCVPGCFNETRTRRSLPIYDEELYLEYLKRINNPELFSADPQKIHRKKVICDSHFAAFCKQEGSNRLKYQSLPTINVPGFLGEPNMENSFLHFYTKAVPLPTLSEMQVSASGGPFDLNSSDIPPISKEDQLIQLNIASTSKTHTPSRKMDAINELIDESSDHNCFRQPRTAHSRFIGMKKTNLGGQNVSDESLTNEYVQNVPNTSLTNKGVQNVSDTSVTNNNNVCASNQKENILINGTTDIISVKTDTNNKTKMHPEATNVEELHGLNDFVIDETIDLTEDNIELEMSSISENPNSVYTMDTIEEQLKNDKKEYFLTSDNISVICRTCLKKKEVKHLYENSFDNLTFVKLLEMCSTIKVEEDDIFSKNICNDCIIELVRSYLFRQKCQKSDETLHVFKDELEKANERRNLIKDREKKLQLLDHDYECMNEESDVKELLKVKKLPNIFKDSESMMNDTMNNEKKKQKQKVIKRFYMYKGNINENSLADVDTNLIEINEKRAKKLMKNSTQKLPKIFVVSGKESDGSTEIANDITKGNMHGATEVNANKENILRNYLTYGISSKSEINTVLNKPKNIKGPSYTEIIKRAIKLVSEGRLGEANRLARNPPRRYYRTRKPKTKTKELKPKIPVERITFPGKCKICNENYANKEEYRKHCSETRHFFKDFSCETCGKRFASKHVLMNHIRIHSSEKPFMCDKCGACFRYYPALNSHIKVHTETKTFACKKCDKKYSSLKDLIRHGKIDHDTEKLCCCEYCGLFFVSKSNLSQHKKRVHMNLKPQKCMACGKGFYSKAALLKHLKVHDNEQYNCKLCNFKFRAKSRLLLHMKCRHPGTDENTTEQEQVLSTECPHCDEICNNKQSLSIHLSEVHDVPICKYCDEIYESENELLDHLIVHADIVDCSCRFCGKVFSDWPTLYFHLVNHKTKKYKCKICHRKYTQSQKLKIHMSVHTKERPYACKFCSKSFIYKTSLVIHERTHTGERPYVCDICGKRNICSSSLKKHRTTHTRYVELKEEFVNVDAILPNIDIGVCDE